MRNEIKKIVEGVANALGYEVTEICSKSRVSDLVLARHICFYIAYKNEMHSLTQIGKSIGGRDHTTVLNGIKRIEGYRYTKDNLYIQYMDAIYKYAPEIYSILKPKKVLMANNTCQATTMRITKYIHH